MVLIYPTPISQSETHKDYFLSPQIVGHKQYEALRAFFVDGLSAGEVARRFGYTIGAVYSLVRDFKRQPLDKEEDLFFAARKPGRKPKDATGELEALIVSLRKKHLSVPDIKALLDVQDYDLSERTIYNVVKSQGFERLPRRSIVAKSQTFSTVKLEAPKSVPLDFSPESFSCRDSLGIVYLLQYVQQFRLDRLIENSRYPETKATDPLSSILSFLALKFFHVGRYTADDVWCMDRGLGLFAGRNVLPKAGWFRSYSHRVTRQMNMALLKGLHKTWQDAGLLSDTANLDFTAIPYWGNASHLENNWSGTRHKALASILAVLAQEPDSGIITYSDTNIRHGNKSQVVLEFLDFYKANGQDDLKYLVFDSKFTTYENLARLDPDVKFLTIRRRGKNIVEQLNELPSSDWKTVRVPGSDGKGRILKVHDTRVVLRDYGKEIRQIAVTGHGKIKPALLITNDLDSTCRELLHKYARRWLVEKSISEQIQFFHLNTISSSMVIKVNFDLTMSILAHNILRLFARDLPGYSHHAALTLYNKFLRNSGSVQIANSAVTVCLKKKRNLPALLTAMQPYQKQKIAVLDHRPLIIAGDTTS